MQTPSIYPAPDMQRVWIPSEDETLTALFVVETPVEGDSGVAHVVEHLVFRESDAFPEPHNLFAALSLLPVTINASTLPGVSFFYLHCSDAEVFASVFTWLQAGLLQQHYSDASIQREKDGVITRELLFYQRNPDYDAFAARLAYCGGRIPALLDYPASQVLAYKQRYFSPGQISCLLATPTQPPDFPEGKLMTPRVSYDLSKHPTVVQRLLHHSAQYCATAPVTPRSPATQEVSQTLPTLTPLTSAELTAIPPATLTTGLSQYWQHTTKVPQFVRRHLRPAQPYQLQRHAEWDWAYRLPLTEHQQPAVLDWLNSAICWAPRLSGSCYTQGVVWHDHELILYGISDSNANTRHAYVQSLRDIL